MGRSQAEETAGTGLKRLSDRIVALLEERPDRIWNTRQLLDRLPDVKAGNLSVTLSNLVNKHRIVRAGRGQYRAAKSATDAAMSVLMADRLAQKTVPINTPIVARRIAPVSFEPPPGKSGTKPGTAAHTAYLRNLVARTAVALDIDLRAARDDEERMDRMRHWLTRAFDLGGRAERGEDVPPDKDERDVALSLSQ